MRRWKRWTVENSKFDRNTRVDCKNYDLYYEFNTITSNPMYDLHKKTKKKLIWKYFCQKRLTILFIGHQLFLFKLYGISRGKDNSLTRSYCTRYFVGYSVQQRSCTDCCCLVIYFLLAAFIIAMGIYAWIAGNFRNLTTAYDPNGKGCGVAYPNYPYIYFASPHANVLLLPFSLSGWQCVYPNVQWQQIRFSSVNLTA